MNRDYRAHQLCVLGYIAISIAPIAWISACVIGGMGMLESISQSATIIQTSPILPFCLGGLASFAFSYAKKAAYDQLDAALTYVMAAGFTLVAMQQCASVYLDGMAGVLFLPQAASNIIHSAGAVTGFGAMTLWILLCFRKGVVHLMRTDEKFIRNRVYTVLGGCMIGALGLFVVNHFVTIPYVVFWAEFCMLVPGGVACIVKSGRAGGHWLADKPNIHPLNHYNWKPIERKEKR